jgi:monoamine oxidase
MTRQLLSLSRRSFLAGALTLPVLHGRARAADVDAVIIGAGAAGIGAARELTRLGLSWRMIEARQRIGGRAFTDTSLGAPFDAGAEMIHFAERNPWTEIAREAGVSLDSGGRFGGWQVYANGRPLGVLERTRRWQAFREMEARQARVAASGRDMSLADAVADMDADQREIARSGLLLVLGEDGERISIIDNQSLWSGSDLLADGGYGALVARHGHGLPVALATPAERIRWGGAGVEVETPSGTIRARTAIITVSVGVLKAGRIRFEPELPAVTRDALAGIGMGALTKIALALDPAGIGVTEGTVLMDAGRAAEMMMIEMLPRGRPLAVAIFGGDFARRIVEAGEAAAVEHLRATLVSMLGTDVRPALGQGRLAGWWRDPHALGAYSVCRPGQAAARAALARPVGDRLWFAGEATGGGGAMTVGGATLAGRQAAREIANRLKG